MTDSDSILLAVPSAGGGLEASCGVHFGRCECFTLIRVVGGEVRQVDVVANPPHEDCLGPVRLLRGLGVQALLTGGIGGRPARGCLETGIQVYFAPRATVGENVQAWLAGRLAPVGEGGLCRGH